MSSNPTGGCQCGKVRYRAETLEPAVLCHCRMCQRALGNAFGFMAPTEGLSISGEPAWFRSSNVAKRGFCRDCGTPLFFKLLDDQKTWVTGGSLDNPDAAPPGAHYGTESRLPWAHLVDDLPSEETKPGGLTGKTPPGIQSYQDVAALAAKETK